MIITELTFKQWEINGETKGSRMCYCAWAPVVWGKENDQGLLIFVSPRGGELVGVLMDSYASIFQSEEPNQEKLGQEEPRQN